MNELLENETEIELRNDNTLPSTGWITNPYIKAATSDNTRKAYQSDVRHFERWGGRLPANPEAIIQYLQAFADKLNSRTLARRITALKNWHRYQDFNDPTAHPAVSKTITGITRVHGKPKDKARPLLLEELLKIVLYLNECDDLASVRDSALLQVGYFGAFRRSELATLKYEHIKWSKEGIEIHLPRSKTDQLNQGQSCAIPYGNDQLCPIVALKRWLEKANIQKGYVFRRLAKGNKLGNTELTPLSINHIIKSRAAQVNLSQIDLLSSHSLRRGFATCAANAKASLGAIMRQGRWKDVKTVLAYIEAVEKFQDNAVNSLLRGE